MDKSLREKRSEFLLSRSRRPSEPDLTVFGIPVSEMTREELQAAIYLASRELQHYCPHYKANLERT